MIGSSKQRGMSSDISSVKRRRASAERMREARAEKDVLIGELETSKAISDKGGGEPRPPTSQSLAFLRK